MREQKGNLRFRQHLGLPDDELELLRLVTPLHDIGKIGIKDAILTKAGKLTAAEFDAIHSVQRAKDVCSVHRIIAAAELRPELIAAVERGMGRCGVN